MADTKMIKEVKHSSLIELLSNQTNNKFYYSIPLYQRDYSWKKENISEFINDIFEAYNDNKKSNYFFGSIITVSEDKEPFKYSLIDGQQRLTTFILFIKILNDDFNDYISKINIVNNNQQFRIASLTIFINNCIWVDIGNKECKIVSEKNDDTSKLIDVILDNSIDNSSVLYKNLEYLKNFYEELKIEHKNNFDLLEFIEFTLKNIEFVKVDTNSRESALKIFSVLNTRGLELTSTDIIKAEAMNCIPESQHKDFESKWKSLEKKAYDLNTSLEALFRYYTIMYDKNNIKGTNNENIKKLWQDKDKWDAIKEFEKFTNCYEYILNLEDAYIWCLRHLLIMGKNAYTWIPAIITMKFKDYNDAEIIEIAKFLTKWHWLHLINGYTIEKIKAFNFSVIEAIYNQENIKNILEIKPRIILYEGQNMKGLSKNACKYLRTCNFYQCKWGKAFLYFIHNKVLLEKVLTASIEFIPMKSIMEIEHIYP
ncbi:DUF262 domain-containing protein [Brachyspira aalborgi]|uniref:DUF262 domain-containing protein n=1 Tax=Brachyspira aalborgi TaxID=29522 RepID=A0A5C8EFA2_9SPIR|nr:DUF262 domain-containing protein [Brachyspira aalborgi]TXJ36659.1 DUF262 domain-containing protein [Brachyspira aalborgi]